MNIRKLRQLSHRHAAIGYAIWPAIVARRKWLQAQHDRSTRIFDRISELLVDDPVLRVDEFEGNFVLSPQSHIFRRIVELGEYEPILTHHCVSSVDPHRDVIDVGANVGFHTVLLAKRLRGRKLLAIEPTKRALNRLRRNIELNGVSSSVSVFAGVASDNTGFTQISTIEGMEEYSSIGVMGHKSIKSRTVTAESVESKTLDDLVQEHGLDVGFIKVDVEGAEHKVFKGAVNTLSHHRPIVLAEVTDYLLRQNGSCTADIIRFYHDLDYIVTDPLHPNEPPGVRESGDIFCVPREIEASKSP